MLHSSGMRGMWGIGRSTELAFLRNANTGEWRVAPTFPDRDPTFPDRDPTLPDRDPTLPECDPKLPECDPTFPGDVPKAPFARSSPSF